MQYIRDPSYFVINYEMDIPKIQQLTVEINNYLRQQPRSATKKQLQPGQSVNHRFYYCVIKKLTEIQFSPTHATNENFKKNIISVIPCLLDSPTVR